jgi:DNA-binding winged helix-turn-helix (wHTH) protein
VAISSRGLDILGVLIKRAGEVVSKDEIIAAVWPGITARNPSGSARLEGTGTFDIP